MGRVLVAQPDDRHGAWLAWGLGHLGHEPVRARDGTEALARLRADSHDLLLADSACAGLDGLQLILEAGRWRPDLPCILTAGWQGGARLAHGLRHLVPAVLFRPCTLGELAEAVGRSLAGPAESPTSWP